MMKISPSSVTKKIAYPTMVAVAATVAVTSCSQQQQDYVSDAFLVCTQQQNQGGVLPPSDYIPVYEVKSSGEHVYKGVVPRDKAETQLIPGRQQFMPQVLPQQISGAQIAPMSDSASPQQAQ
ncbi:MAG: hypothetical protein IKW19_00500 [Akkermansia sp.]|nr:hypothetical protein [Akkermansia sp.]MBR5184752.1 hypothetical protein [Akkermansia sp.]